jgi:pyruvate, water dikinase
MTLVAGAAGPQQSDILGSPSYAIVSQDYMNFNARFGYHFATVDALCGDDANQNYVTLQFAGGVGSYYGRSLRIQFLANVLERLGFSVEVKGDLIEASLSRIDRNSMEAALDQMGRLLGSSRLMDMGIAGPEEVVTLTESFFRKDYNFLERGRENEPHEFYISTGHWRRVEKDGRSLCLQDGSQYATWISSSFAGVMDRFLGSGYQEFLDNIGAYYYFPLAIAKESRIKDGTVRVRVKPVAGRIDQAGGIAFGIRDVCNYFVFRINAMENNAILFEFKHSKRLQLVTVNIPIPSNVWYTLQVEVAGSQVKAYLNDGLLIEYEVDRSLEGYVGLWTKADSVTEFDSLEFGTPGGMRTVGF